jgi:hypothetical protein
MTKKYEESVYEGEFTARVNRTEDTTENILSHAKDAVHFVTYSGRTSKFKSGSKYRMVITEIVEEEAQPEASQPEASQQ